MWRLRSSRKKSGWNQRRRSSSAEFLEDVHQLPRAMSAGVARSDGLQARCGELAAGIVVAQEALDFRLHGGAIRHHQVILAGTEQTFSIGPGGAQQHSAAGQRFKDANGRDAAEAVGVLAARYVKREQALRISFRRAQVGQVTAEINTGGLQPLQRILRVANAIHSDATVRHLAGGSDEKFLQLAGALLVPPVADPDEVVGLLGRQRPEDVHGGGFVKGPGAGEPEAVHINAPNRCSKGEHAVEQVEPEAQDVACAGVGAVMRVVKQDSEAELALELEDSVDDFRLVPFVDDDHVGAAQVFQRKLSEGGVVVIELDIQLGVNAAKLIHGINGAIALDAHQVGERPGAELLVAAHCVALAHESARQAAQKMGVAVVPVGNPGVREVVNVPGPAHTVTPGSTASVGAESRATRDEYRLM